MVFLRLGSFVQPLRIAIGIDTPATFDRTILVNGPTRTQRSDCERLTWTCKSTLWNKLYHLDVHDAHLALHAEVRGHGAVDTIRYLEDVADHGFREHFLLTKHFNDHGQTTYRAYSRGSPPAFDKVFCPEPNSHTRQYFHPHEYAQASVNADLDYHGGNFIANPGLLCFAFTDRGAQRWLAAGIAARPGEHLFSEFEYVGGHEFGLNLNCWGARNVEGEMTTPTLLLVPGRSRDEALRGYVQRLTDFGSATRHAVRDHPGWWRRPIVCGWGHQAYMGDLFRIRSPRERPRDNAVYTLSAQAVYRDLVTHWDNQGVPWGTLVIDGRWFLAGGLKDVDHGRWPDLRGFVDALHARGKRVLLWWAPWDTDGVDASECVRFQPDETTKQNRPGRLSKFGAPTPGKKLAIDVTLETVRNRIERQVHRLLGGGLGCFDVDGVKIDHVAAVPGLYGMSFPTGSAKLFGVEAVHAYYQLLHETVKSTKSDALIIGQSPHPYLAQLQDMLRLGDIYTHDSATVVEQMRFRADMARIADSDWLVDTDGWPMPSRAALQEYVVAQPSLGVPSLYYATHLDTTGEALTHDDFALIRTAWSGL